MARWRDRESEWDDSWRRIREKEERIGRKELGRSVDRIRGIENDKSFGERRK